MHDFQNKRVLITGGTGMIGHALSKILLPEVSNLRIISLDNVETHDDIEYIKGDLTDLNFCLKVIKDVDYVFQIAGIKGSARVTKTRPATFFVPLLQMNLNVFEAARKSGCLEVIYTSSIGAYPSIKKLSEDNFDYGTYPMDEYPGWAKRMGELQLKAYKEEFGTPDYVIVRPANVYGPRDNFDPENAMVVGSLLGRALSSADEVEVLGTGKSIRDFVFADDVANGIYLAGKNGGGESFNLGSGAGVSIKELASIIQKVTGKNLKFSNSVEPDYPVRILDITKASNLLGWKPKTSLEQGIKITWNWLKENLKFSEMRHNYFSKD